ncbi:tetratricopeptide repeat protein [Wolbachia endosymbiont (group A) of Sphecodes monilicornis]|uniref:tetratricopeptide repeat protein n=1 Tax=Wolbachia endosymbiont (group A) of Sphecodes monilicornis TaxID=2954060 RepID=UPI0022312F2E|nr:tetratricopeptide repeat protein [Wolbachia endosymbiont (group A) of Sphecodes monilicornis]
MLTSSYSFLYSLSRQVLSNAHGDLGNLQKAKELLERALAIQEKHYEPNHFTVAIILKNLGGTYGDLGDS